MQDAKPEQLSQSDYAVLSRFRFALRQFTAFSTRAAQAAGLPAQQHQALLTIKGHAGPAPMSVGVLAEHLLIAPQTATELVNRLADGGLVARVTDKAEALLGSLTMAHLREMRQLAPTLIELLQTLERRE